VKFGLILPLFSGDPEKVLGFAKHAERLGYDGVFAFDHFFPPGGARDHPSLEAFASLATIGVATERISVGTLVTRVGVRSAGILAKMTAQIDDMTGGRMIVGIGTGDKMDQAEHEAFALPVERPWPERREALEETIGAMKALYRGERWPGGEQVPPLAGPLLPPPSRPGGPPVWVGAKADAVLRIAARVADGWNGWGLSRDAFAEKAELLAREAADRDVEPSWSGVALVGENEQDARRLREARGSRGFLDEGLWNGSAAQFAEFAADLAEAGAAWAIVVPAGPPDRMELIANTVLPESPAR